MKVLVIEDDQLTQSHLLHLLKACRYTVDVAAEGKLGLGLALEWDYDLIVMDVMLPGMDGVSLCRQLRSQGCQAPILLLTSKKDVADVVAGLDAGADDYVVKPYELATLMARVRALLRRRERVMSAPILRWHDLCINPATAEVFYQGTLVTVSPKEYGLLELFLRFPNRIFNRAAIIDALWSSSDAPTESAVTNLIKDVRRKLRAMDPAADPFETVYGLGYRLREVSEAVLVGDRPPSGAGSPLQSTVPHIPQSLQEVLRYYQKSFESQVHILEQAVQAMQAHQLGQELQQRARQEAHKLIGGAGTFGYTTASELARQLEQGFAQPEGVAATQLAQWLLDLKRALASPPQPLVAPLSSRSAFTLVSNEPALIAALQAEAAHQKIELCLLAPAQINQLNGQHPEHSVVLLDLASLVPSDFFEASAALLQSLKHTLPDIMLIALTSQTSLEERVVAARLGVQRVLSKPLTASEILAEIRPSLLASNDCAIANNKTIIDEPRAAAPPAKLLVVDDDPIALAGMIALLQAQRFQVIGLAQPQDFWQVFTTSQPDLLLLDLEMPTFNGTDLCRVVRQDPHWCKLPILVVTAHTDEHSIEQAFAAGADDFIRKPIVETELIMRIHSWLERQQAP